jgi:hypothetical protein
MKPKLKQIIGFLSEHRLFSMFFIIALIINGFLAGLSVTEKKTFISCSTFDAGPMGTYGFYHYIKNRNTNTNQVRLSYFRTLDPVKDRGKTLFVLSPLFQVGAWEWQRLLDWVAAGNRLITSGKFTVNRPMDMLISKYSLRKTRGRRIWVSLPVDSEYPYKKTLRPPPDPIHLLDKEWQKNTPDDILINTIPFLQPGTLPLLCMDTTVIAAKKKYGQGEWVMFACPNPFANRLLQDADWFEFACRLLFGDIKYQSNAFIFDEYHNGYQATKSLWQLLSYYEFTTGMIFLAVIMLLYLFFTGIRIIRPRAIREATSRDLMPGLRSMAGIFYRFKAFSGLIERERRTIARHLFGSKGEQMIAERIVDSYLKTHPLPGNLKSRRDLIQVLKSTNYKGHMRNSDFVTIFNTLMHMRKELAS